MDSILVTCYFSIACFLFVLCLFIYGLMKSSPSNSLDEDDLGGMIVVTMLWPIALAILIVGGISQLPIMLGKYVGKKAIKRKAKREFKETISKHFNGEK